jgi:hypothetical protein
MRRPIPFPFLLALAALACGGTAEPELAGDAAALDVGDEPDAATACVFTTQLRPENEVLPTPPADPDQVITSVASGHSQVKIRTDGTLELRTFIRNPAGETFVAGHVHGEALAGANAPVVVPLFASEGDASAQIRQVTELAIDETLAARICEAPERFYVNYHTTLDPGGAIRGQLR